jgi:hypothetical protein
MIPFMRKLDKANRILIAGCGGGFDVFAGIPIAYHLMAAGKTVTFANLSFTNLWICGGEKLTSMMWRVDRQSVELPYFPERWLTEWITAHGQAAPVYAFGRSGARPLQQAYEFIVERHAIDLILLVDGGTDSVLFGDEPGLGTVAEDAVSIVAACAAGREQVMLAALGFGVDHYHGVSNYAFLENVAQLIRLGGFLGAFSLVAGTPEATALTDLVDYANRRQSQHQSIVCNSVVSALRGEFGDYHATNRTTGSELFINPLMAQYWTFEAQCIVDNMRYGSELAGTERIEDVRAVIERERDCVEIRPRKQLPL